MKNKKTIMFFSSLLIVIFHLWINIFERTNVFYEIETFLRQICYIGVDIFFFLSSYSISKSDIKEYKKYLFMRFQKVYIPFLIFVLISFIYYNWNLKTFLLTISGLNLFIKGGGSFLWFIPAIMIIYILLPLFKKIDNKYKIVTPIITIFLWLVFTLLLSLCTSYDKIFIFTNRIPIILIGYYCAKYKIIEKLSKINYIIVLVVLIIFGIFLSYNFKNINLNFIQDIFYLISIPLTLGLILLINLIPANKLIKILGSITLEMYGLQMIFGYKIASTIYSLFKNALISNIITISIIIMLSILINYLFNLKFLELKKGYQ